MGLKTASYSQARQLIVMTAPADRQRSVRAWDLDLVIRSGEPPVRSSTHRVPGGCSVGN